MPGAAGLGAAYWGSAYTGGGVAQALSAGTAWIAAQGFQSIKIPFDPANMVAAFPGAFPSGFSYAPGSFFQAALALPQVQSALGQPGIGYIVLAAFDDLTQGGQYLNLNFVQTNQTALVTTYQQLALGLLENPAYKGKTFVIGNWESDNAVYYACGEAYGFELAMKADPGSPCTTVAQVNTSYQALETWYHYRMQGIQAARTQAAAAGFSGVTVLSGIEFNTVHMLQDVGYPNMLSNIAGFLPNVDVLAYSSYESINQGTLPTDVPYILATYASGTPLIISEFGFAEGTPLTIAGVTYPADTLMKNTGTQLLTLLNGGQIGGAIAWEAFQDSGNFGLMNASTGAYLPLLNSLLSGMSLSSP